MADYGFTFNNEEVARYWRKLHNEELLFCLIKSRKILWAGL
jgi:hypothetical protein